ncbi:U-box domain-containing protein 43-like [Nymphaea colorata]|nr:U-box domain-containing protein 43-like [Nymphaea colorata]
MDSSLLPISETLSKIIEEIVLTISAAKDVLVEKHSFTQLTGYLERVVPVLKELARKEVDNSENVRAVVEILDRETKVLKQLVVECGKRNKIYLLVNCRRIVSTMQESTNEFSRALSLIPLASLDLSLTTNEEIKSLYDVMRKAQFRAAVAQEDVLQNIESGIRERSLDRAHANNLLLQIAEAVGVPKDRSAMRKEFEEFKREKEDAQLRKDRAEAIQMEQIIALLSRADIASTPKERQDIYLAKRNSLGSQPFEPLQSFYCPITHEVMVDPVETVSGQTFERNAIEKWLADGNMVCPLTMISLAGGNLRPNVTLRKSIEEWKERNTLITIASIKSKLSSSEEQEVLNTLEQLQCLCTERESYRECVVLENYIPVLVGLMGGNKVLVRKKALDLLCLLAEDREEYKQRIASVENAIEYMVRSLSRATGEGVSAVSLLYELSKVSNVLERIGEVHGSIFFLVMMMKRDEPQAAKTASELLLSLSFSEQNVVLMAKANYFEPLLQRLCTGSGDVKVMMAKALAEMELTDFSKAALCDSGVITALLDMISNGDSQSNQAAIDALSNLSTVPRNAILMIRENAAKILLDLLDFANLTSLSLRERAAVTFMNLAFSAASPEASGAPFLLLQSDSDICRLFVLVSLCPNIQESILRAFHVMCQLSIATEMRAKLREVGAIQLLVQFCEHGNLAVRASAVQLFFSLTQDCDGTFLVEHVNKRSLEALLRIIRTSDRDEEKAAAMGVLENFPTDDTQTTDWLLELGALPVIVEIIESGCRQGLPQNHFLLEKAAGTLRRFTLPMNIELQKRVAKAGIISILVRLLTFGTPQTKRQAALSLAQFSENSKRLSKPVEGHRRWMCFSAPAEPGCRIHGGVCSVESTFCLLEADAVEPLVRALSLKEMCVCEAALQSLSTLIEAEQLQSGSKLLHEKNAIAPIINLMSIEECGKTAEKALHVIERIFRLEEYKSKFGQLAQTHLVEMTQRSDGVTRSLAAKVLALLDVLPNQSSFF